jgi:Zn-dependent peptidase ImmA (M78 family)
LQLRENWGNREQPILDLFTEIRSRTEIRVVRRPFDGVVDGAIIAQGARRVMVINTKSRNLGRQRMTAAHELGHYDQDSRPFAEAIGKSNSPPELFADGFAVELLEPETAVRGWVSTHVAHVSAIRPAVVSQLAAYFHASYELTARRLFALEIVSGAKLADLLEGAGRAAAYEGAVLQWYDENLAAAGAMELPADYLARARRAYDDDLVSLRRLGELEFRTADDVRRELAELTLLHEDDKEAEGADQQATSPSPKSGTRAKK